MEPAQRTQLAAHADPNACTAEAPMAAPDASMRTADKLVAICFLIAVALFGLISLIDLVTSPFR